MKKTIKMMLALMAGAVAFTACSNDDEILENINNGQQATSLLKPMTFTAFQEGQNSTQRAAIVGDGKTHDINWVSGDEISIFDGSSENNGDQKFTLSAGSGTTSGTFSGSADEDADTYYALYPYMASTCVDVTLEMAQAAAGSHASSVANYKNSISQYPEDAGMYLSEVKNYWGLSSENATIVLAYLKDEPAKGGVQRNASNQFEGVIIPALQTVADGQFVDPKAMLMIGKTEEDKTTLEFKNVCAFVKVKPMFNCKAIRISSNGTESLAGTVTVDYNDGNPTTTITDNGTNVVALYGSIIAENTYYIAVRPETLASGFTISFLATTNHYYTRGSSKDLGLARNKVINLGQFKTDDTSWTEDYGFTGTAKANIEGSDADVEWVMLWDWSPRFATVNVGVTDGDPKSFGGHYCWGGSYKNGKGITWYDDHNTGWTNLTGNDDTATKIWGSNWRMPTKEELQALLDNCTCTLTEDGMLCTGKATGYTDNSIFLPATGYCDDDGISNSTLDRGFYTSSTSNYGWPFMLFFRVTDSNDTEIIENNAKDAHPVRAVLK